MRIKTMRNLQVSKNTISFVKAQNALIQYRASELTVGTLFHWSLINYKFTLGWGGGCVGGSRAGHETYL